MSLLPGETLPFEHGRKRKLKARHNLSDSKSNGSHQKVASPKKKKSNKRSPVLSRQKALPSAKPR
jgi:hypothetical protein